MLGESDFRFNMAIKHKIVATRWALVPVAAMLGFIVAVIISWLLNGLIHSILWSSGHHMPGKLFIALVLPYDGAIAASLVLLFGSLMAPTHRLGVAAILLLIGGFIAWELVGDYHSPTYGGDRIIWPLIGTYMGGLTTFAILYVRLRSTK